LAPQIEIAVRRGRARQVDPAAGVLLHTGEGHGALRAASQPEAFQPRRLVRDDALERPCTAFLAEVVDEPLHEIVVDNVDVRRPSKLLDAIEGVLAPGEGDDPKIAKLIPLPLFTRPYVDSHLLRGEHQPREELRAAQLQEVDAGIRAARLADAGVRLDVAAVVVLRVIPHLLLGGMRPEVKSYRFSAPDTRSSASRRAGSAARDTPAPRICRRSRSSSCSS